MTNPKTGNETAKISQGIITNSLNIRNKKSENGFLKENSLDVFDYFTRDISFNKIESESTNVSVLYKFKNIPAFVKHFSLSEIIKNTLYKLEELINGVVVMVNTSNVLLKECEWNYGEAENSLEIFKADNNMTISHIMQFLQNFILKSRNSYPHVHVYKFDYGKNTKLVTDFGNNPTEKTEENLNENLDKCRNTLLFSVVKNTNGGKDINPQINEALSKLYNHENDSLSQIKSKNCAYFLRIILFTTSPKRDIDSEMYYNVMSSYNNPKNKIRAGILNLMLMESDFYLSNLSPEDNLLKFSDINYTKISLNESTEKMKVLYEFYEGIESEIKELSDKIMNYGKSYFDHENLINNKMKSGNKQNVEIIKEFVKKIDEEFKLFSNLVEGVCKNISELNKSDVSRDVLQRSTEMLNQVSNGIIISDIMHGLQKTMQSFYENKSVKENIFDEIKNEIKMFYDSISRLEKKIKPEGKNFNLIF
jgi:hypothetical protein